MSNWTFTVGSTPKSQTGTLTWNPNGTLQKLVIGDGFNAGGAQTCKFGDPSTLVAGYDDLGRLVRADCGSAWLQTFSYDQYANITKSGSSAWAPGYDSATNRALPPITYDNNGNLTNDTLHTYGWYVDNKLGSTDSTTCGIFGSTDGTCILYDAFGREVERGINGVYTEVMYTPVGKTAIMNGEFTTLNAYFPLPGGGTYYQTGNTNGTGYFWHKDGLGSVRLSSSVLNRTFYFDRAFAPYGEMYKNFGNTGGLNFTGDTQDSFAGLFDTPNRELHPSEGRWLSPDPAGLAAVDPGNPQTWNRYAYVGNNPLSFVDPLGLNQDACTAQHPCGGNSPGSTSDPGFSFSPTGGGGVFGGALNGMLFNVTQYDFSASLNFQWDNFSLSDLLTFANQREISLDAVTSLGVIGFPGGIPGGDGNSAFTVAASNVSKQYGLTTPCGSSASQIMGAVEGNFAQFGNYSRWGGLESVTFSPPSGMGTGSTIPISVSVFGFTQNLSVNVQSMNSQSMTFTTNPGHLLYPASITFAASPASPGSINFNINLGGTVASPTQFYFGGSSFENAQWKHFLGKVGGFCKVGG